MHKTLWSMALDMYRWCKRKIPESERKKCREIKITEREISFRRLGWQDFESGISLDNSFIEGLPPNDLKHWRLGYKMSQDQQEINQIIKSLKSR